MFGFNVLNDFCDRSNDDDTEWYPCPTHLKRPRFFFYETRSTYVGIAISFAYIVTALILYTFDVPEAKFFLIPALLINLPHLFRRCLDYIPLLFRQVFYNWAYLILNLTLLWIFSLNEFQPSSLGFIEGIFYFTAIYIHPVLSRCIYFNFKLVFMRHWLGHLKLRHVWVHALLTCMNASACLWLAWSVVSIKMSESIFFLVPLFISCLNLATLVDIMFVHGFILFELSVVGHHLWRKHGLLKYGDNPITYKAQVFENLKYLNELSRKRK